MYFIDGRIQRFLNDIAGLIYTDTEEIRNWQIRHGEIPKNVDLGICSETLPKKLYPTIYRGRQSFRAIS